MKYVTRFTLLALLTCTAGLLFAQAQFRSQMRDAGTPFYHVDVARFPTEVQDTSRVEIFIRVPYDDLQFVKYDSVYRAEYEVSIVVFDKDGIQADGEIKRHMVQVREFKRTNATDEYDNSRYAFTLHNSVYKVSVGLMDMDTRKTSYRKNTIDLKAFQRENLQISDLVLVDKVERQADGTVRISPNVLNRLNDKQGELYLYFTAVGQEGIGEIETSILDTEGEAVRTLNDTIQLGPEPRQKVIQINRSGLNYSKYRFRVALTQEEASIKREKEFRVAWVGLSSHIANLDIAIEQMIYILPSSEINKMKKAKADRKKQIFLDYWKKRDPSPETDENELMNEYYKRVNYATEQFGSSIREGWRTDMGMVYILFGAPNDIERHPFDLGSKPYQIWYYFEINRQFVFVDDTGFGDYRLVTPLYDTYQSPF